MRFIHSSDWQLGKPFGRASEQTRAALLEARLDAIDALAAAARREGAGLVLVAGDVFDSPEPGDRIYRQALTRMKAAADIRWVLLPGNHDPARADGLWSRLVGEAPERSEEHTSELQSLMRISYAVFCLKQKIKQTTKLSPDSKD